ncbi:MAG: DUF4091 domain-containing protein [Anaerolineae bacterium]|nr:DUF4091 domain-containing protein [Anaerolineae bacterium]
MSPVGARLEATHEWSAHDPFGRPKAADRAALAGGVTDPAGAAVLRAARGGYASFRVLVHGQGAYRLSASIGSRLEIDLYKAWYHRMRADQSQPDSGQPDSGQPDPSQPANYWPDALIPVGDGHASQLPDPENQIPGQTVQAFWVDVYVPADVPPGPVTGAVRLDAGAETDTLRLRVLVLEPVLPERPCVTMDHNSYGARWLFDSYPRAFAGVDDAEVRWERAAAYLQHHYRLVREHRGLFHNLGYGHSGAFDPIYGPRSIGRGRDKKLVDWERYDRHYGPLLDGSAFRTAGPGMPRPRQAPRPLESVYTPINPDWPASYLWWGELGYEFEFTRCVAQFDAHLRRNGWTETVVEFFANHKKRYRWFEWDGDEVKQSKDLRYHRELVRLWEQAIGETPVPWVYRADVSWQMRAQFEAMAGHRNFWVCGGFHRWYRGEVAQVVARGDIVWWYGGAPPVQAATSAILSNVYQTWARGLHGYCAWQTVAHGPDPWTDCDGCATALVYPGERFGIAGPIPSIRLKVQRNGIQDIDLIHQRAAPGAEDALRAELAQRIPIPLWADPPPAAQRLPPEEWDSRNLEEHEPLHGGEEGLDPGWWRALRDRALGGEEA